MAFAGLPKTNIGGNGNCSRFLPHHRLASLVGITEREKKVGKLGWHGNSTGFNRKNIYFFPILRNERKKKD